LAIAEQEKAQTIKISILTVCGFIDTLEREAHQALPALALLAARRMNWKPMITPIIVMPKNRKQTARITHL
jgi:hypothetical protein